MSFHFINIGEIIYRIYVNYLWINICNFFIYFIICLHIVLFFSFLFSYLVVFYFIFTILSFSEYSSLLLMFFFQLAPPVAIFVSSPLWPLCSFVTFHVSGHSFNDGGLLKFQIQNDLLTERSRTCHLLQWSSHNAKQLDTNGIQNSLSQF